MSKEKDVIAVDLGGTHLRVARVKRNKVLEYVKKETPRKRKDIVKEIKDSIEILMNKNVKGIGIALAGVIEDGTPKVLPNLPLKNVNLKKIIQKKFRKRVEIENDANCAALAEVKYGVKKKNFIILTLGTGIGGGIIINGGLYKGQGFAGELGHIILEKNRDLETLAAGKTIKNYSKKEIKRISTYLGRGIASLISVLDPEAVILSGGMKNLGRGFLNQIKKETEKNMFLPRKTEIKWSGLRHPGIFGASLLIN